MHKMLKTVVGTLHGFVETLHCNVSTATALLWLMLCCFHAPAFAGLTDGLVAYYCFDDSTNIGKDCSSNENNGASTRKVDSR